MHSSIREACRRAYEELRSLDKDEFRSLLDRPLGDVGFLMYESGVFAEGPSTTKYFQSCCFSSIEIMETGSTADHGLDYQILDEESELWGTAA